MSKHTKEEYKDVFNKIFGTNIDWTKLSKKELEEFAEALSKGDWMKHFGITTPKERIDDILDKIRKTVKNTVKSWHGPVIDRLREFIREEKD